MTESVSSDFVRQVRMALEVLAGETSMSPTNELAALVGGGGAYLHAEMNDQSSDLSVNDHVEFDEVLEVDASGDIALSTAAGQSGGILTLAEGKVFLVEAGLSLLFSSFQGVLRYQFRQNNIATLFGSKAAGRSLTSNVDEFVHGIAVGIIDTTGEVATVELRIIGEFNPMTIRGSGNIDGSSFLKVLEIA